MKNGAEPRPIRLTIDIANGGLADELAELLAQVPGLQLVGPGEAADAIVTQALRQSAEASLSPRELQVLGLLAEGASNKEIARRLGISVHTAKFHVSQLIDKLDAIGRTDALAHAARLGVIAL